MLNLIAEHGHPRMLAMLVDGEARVRKGRIGKGAKWNSRNAEPAFDDIGYG
jgi:hypothetical protein